MGTGHGHQGPALGHGRIGHGLLPGLDGDARRARGDELGMVGLDRGQGLGHGQPRRRCLGHVGRVMFGHDPDAPRLERRGVLRGSAGVAAIGRTPGLVRQQGRRGGTGPGRSDDVDALTRRDGASRAGGRQAAGYVSRSRITSPPPR